jgi:hypothetical protein
MVPAQPAEAGGEGEAEELEDTDVEHSMLLMWVLISAQKMWC